MVAEFKRRRDMLVPALNQIPGVQCHMPRGAFYALPNTSAFGMSSDELAMLLLREAGVAVVPGSTLGPAGEGYLRVSYANSYEKIAQAVQRMKATLGQLSRRSDRTDKKSFQRANP
jgi:aspartate/methionine/tyrosine aminotransferase